MATGLPRGFEQYSLPTMGGEQKGIYDLLRGQFQGGGGDVLQKLFGMAQGQGDIFQQMEGPARRGLEGELGRIGQQFGLAGNQKSSGFQNAISGAGRDFSTDLYGKRADLMQKSIQDVLGIGNQLLGTPTQQFGLVQKAQGPNWNQLAGPGGEALSGILQGIIGKPKPGTAGVDGQPGTSEGIDWGQIAGTAAKYLPLLLSML